MLKSIYTMEECKIVSNSFSMEHDQRLQHEIASHAVLKGLFKQLLTILQIVTLLAFPSRWRIIINNRNNLYLECWNLI